MFKPRRLLSISFVELSLMRRSEGRVPAPSKVVKSVVTSHFGPIPFHLEMKFWVRKLVVLFFLVWPDPGLFLL